MDEIKTLKTLSHIWMQAEHGFGEENEVVRSMHNIIKTRQIQLLEIVSLIDWLNANVGSPSVDWGFYGAGILEFIKDPWGQRLDIAIKDTKKAIHFKVVWG